MSQDEARSQETIRLQLLWFHQAQFAGFYLADDKGFYEREGIEVEFIEGAGGLNPLDELAAGRADVAISWLPPAVAARKRGQDVVNIGQIFQRSGTAIVCRRGDDLRSFDDVAGKSIGVWNIGDELNVRHWQRHHGVSDDAVTLVPQRPDGRDLIDGNLSCAAAMMYNEYWSLLRAGLKPGDLLLTRLADEGLGFLEDGLYVRQGSLADPARRDALTRFLRATLEGWAYARRNVEEALAVSLERSPGAAAAGQRFMLETILPLVGDESRIGLLDIGAYERSLAIIDGQSDSAAGRGGWTHTLWRDTGFGEDDHFFRSAAVDYYLERAVAAGWFYALDLVGTAAFAIAGFMRARQRRYDLWGAFILTLLPAVGGGTLRDLLVGGDRYPPFILNDPNYIYIVLSVVILGTLVSRLAPDRLIDSRRFDGIMVVFDTIGMAAFTVIGAKVAVLANLDWIWVPICAALTCAGGGMLLDIVTGREPRTFLGEPYEEVAIVGGLLMCAGLMLADRHEHAPWIVTLTIIFTMLVVFSIRLLVVKRRLRSFRLGGAVAGGL